VGKPLLILNIIKNCPSGLNKKCSIYKLTEGVEVIKRPKMDVAIHRSYITDSVFLGSDQQVVM
jgi:hypothetical protein